MRRVVGTLVLLALGCGGPTAPQDPPPLLNALPRDLTPAEQRTAAASNAFGFDLLRAAASAEAEQSHFLSPLSATMALGLALNGAAGETFDSMRAGLRFGTTPIADINAGYKGLLALLKDLDPDTRLDVANAVWLDAGAGFHPSYLSAARDWFDAEARVLDFGAQAEALAAINGWVSDKTQGKIPTLLEDIDPNEIAFLMNAVYFKGAWRHQFNPERTRPAVFHAEGGDQTVPTMHLDPSEHRYASDADAEVLEMMYGNGGLVMTLVVPRAGKTLAGIVATLDTVRWSAWTAALRDAKVAVAMPKFRLELKRELADDLKALGMGIAFDANRANFSAMRPVSPGQNVFITRVTQKTFVEVNEEGTEAAAATSVGIGVTSMPPTVQVDRPFLIAIRERFAGTILFLGQVTRIP
jgi:serpin B